MRITELRTFVAGNPWKNWLFVQVCTDEGVTGLGEATGGLETRPIEEQVREIGRFVIGEDPLSPVRLWQKIYKGMFLRPSLAASAIEIACWDILGKTLNAPVWKLLGGKQRPRLRVYANGWYKGPRDPGFFGEAAARVKEMGYTALNAVRLEQAIPWYGYDFTEKQIPHEAGLQDSHISYTKGCYTGQEIVERVRSRGQVNRTRVSLKFDTPNQPAPNTALLFDGKEFGYVTRTGFSPAANTFIGMGYVRREKAAPESVLELAGGTATVYAAPVSSPG